MIRIAILLVFAVFAALAAVSVASQPGAVTIEWFGTRIETTALFGVLAMTFLMAMLLPAVRFLMAVIDAPGKLGKASERARRRRGQEALALGLIAAESGEFEEARRHAERAENLIDEPRLAILLEARAAEMSGDVSAAERAYTGMLASEGAELLGRKGLLSAALQRGDRRAAIEHAAAALKLSRSATWPFQTLFDLQVQGGDWDDAVDALDEGERRKLIEPAAAARRRAVLLAAAAQRDDREGRLDVAIDKAEKGVRQAPGFAPAAALAARLMAEDGKVWKAASILEEAWAAAPHPAIAHAYRDLRDDEPPLERAKRLGALIELKPEHRESRILSAELAIEQKDWAAAWRALEEAYKQNPSSRICALYAVVCRGKNDEIGARNWLAQAAFAQREADWSDLDPEGAAFLYEDADWARLVYVYGDTGKLIHPRLERGGRDAGAGSVLALPPLARRVEAQIDPSPIRAAQIAS
ncbi:MAG: heme biosynthesis HemY N-terminal domain-containing protein [Hyphomonadaceae bacterium]